MNKTVLVLCLMVGFVTAFDWQNLLSLIKPDPLTMICNTITINPSGANNILDKLEKALTEGNIGQTFPFSVNYVTNQSNLLLAGGDSCKSFFNGLQTPFQTDLQNNKQKVTNVKQQLIEFINNKLGPTGTLFG